MARGIYELVEGLIDRGWPWTLPAALVWYAVAWMLLIPGVITELVDPS